MNSLVTLEVAKQCHGSQNTNEEHSEILQIAAAHYKMSHSFRDSDFTAKIANFLPVKICMNRVTVACIKQLYTELMNLAYDNQMQSFVWCALYECLPLVFSYRKNGCLWSHGLHQKTPS